jgi:hypothetical protein
MRLKPLYNASDRTLREVFLQDVMGMSARSYDRRMLSLALRSGQRRPQSYESVEELLRALDADPLTVSFAWAEDISSHSELKAIRVLWRN